MHTRNPVTPLFSAAVSASPSLLLCLPCDLKRDDVSGEVCSIISYTLDHNLSRLLVLFLITSMPLPDESIHPVATGAAAETVSKHESPQDIVFYCALLLLLWLRKSSR